MTRNQPVDPAEGKLAAGAGSPLTDDAGWTVLCYLLTGVLLFGGAGWGLDRLLGTSFLVVVGLLGGAGLAVYVIYLRYGRA